MGKVAIIPNGTRVNVLGYPNMRNARVVGHIRRDLYQLEYNLADCQDKKRVFTQPFQAYEFEVIRG